MGINSPLASDIPYVPSSIFCSCALNVRKARRGAVRQILVEFQHRQFLRLFLVFVRFARLVFDRRLLPRLRVERTLQRSAQGDQLPALLLEERLL